MIYGRNFINNNVAKIPGQAIEKVQGRKDPVVNGTTNNQNSGFGKILNEQINKNSGLKFSKHAEFRLHTRNINLSGLQIDRINQAVTKAEGKGVKDSLILMDDIALVVSVKNKTVVTVANKNELKDNVFTNIDGAVIV